MLKISTTIVESIHNARHVSDLYQHLQAAIELEHATIPAYLQAFYSIKPGTNEVIAATIRSIVTEEMLHMTIAANVLNAINGQPVINKPDFVPNYPGPLPMNLHDGLAIGLAPLSMQLLQDVFMEIEMPEDMVVNMTPDARRYASIGQFYNAIIDKLNELGEKVIDGDPRRQVLGHHWFPSNQLFAISDLESAVRAIELIVRQGEGSLYSPVKGSAELPHYYRFAEIFYGRRLLPDPTARRGYSYAGAPILFDASGVRSLVPDPKMRGYAAGSTARAYAERFNGIYTNLLNGLHQTFNGQPKHISRAIASMYELRLAAAALIDIQLPDNGMSAAPTFEYFPTDAAA